MNYEVHTIRKFRGTNLGIIRLNQLAKPDGMKITIGGIEIKPIGYDTYGHPIISASNFKYYQALKSNYNRKEITFLTEVYYEPKVFCVRREIYDSKEAIEKAIFEEEKAKREDEYTDKEYIMKKIAEEQNEKLKKLKELLVYRKQAAFLFKPLNYFMLYGRYILASNGHVYSTSEIPADYIKNLDNEDVIELDSRIMSEYELTKEVHIPGNKDVCAICGNEFTINDVKEGYITENEQVEKVHCECQRAFSIQTELNVASQIIDAVYEDNPKVNIEREYDLKEQKEKIWYCYKTNQGTISIRFKNKVIVIEWHDNFKPFNMTIFDGERVTKYDRGIHAWSKNDAIRYLSMAKKA